MGHLTLIAEEVVKFTERHPPELLSETVLDRVMSQDWINYVEGALAETRERDNAILGGVRPEVALGNRASMGGSGLGGIGLSSIGGNTSNTGSNALAEAGLNGGIELSESNNNGIGPFTISNHGTLMSGFGSSSDEEDEDGDGDDEDVNSEVSGDSPEDFGLHTSMDYSGNAGNIDSPEDVIMRSPEPVRSDSPDLEDLSSAVTETSLTFGGEDVRSRDDMEGIEVQGSRAEQIEDVSKSTNMP